MSLKVGELNAELGLDSTRFASGLTAAQGLAKRAGLLIAGALAGAAAKSVAAFAQMDTGMREVFTLMPGMSEQAMTAMTDDVKAFAAEYGLTTSKAIPALYQAISAGVPPDNVLTFMETAARMARGGVTDLETSVDGLSTAVNAYGVEVLSAEDASDIMFCLRTDQRVLTVDRGLVPIGELADGARVLAYDGQQFVEAHATFVPQPDKPTVRVTTRLGRQIVTTPNHPYLVARCRHGASCQAHSCKRTEWVEVQNLKVGDRVAVPTALGQAFGHVTPSEHRSGLLGLWLAEGTSQLGSVQITSTDYGDDLNRWAAEWGCTVNTTGISHRLVRKDQTANPVMDWLRLIGLGNCTAASKHIPGVVFTWDRDSTAVLLRWLFNGDGWLSDTDDARRHGGHSFQLGFCSKSERLVRDVSHLLLRFGIVGRIRRRGNCEAWVWETSRHNEITRFLDHVGIDRGAVKAFRAYTPLKLRHRQNVVEYDPIVEIEPLGDGPVADLYVPGLCNFVAEDIIAHNTTVRLGKTTIGELSDGLFQVVPVASAAGVSFDQVSAALAAITLQGTPTNVAATNLRGALVELGREGTIAFGKFREASGQTFPEFIAAGGTLKEAIDLMAANAAANGTSIQNSFGSIEAGMAATVLASDTGSAQFGANMDAMAGRAGATDQAFDTMAGGIGFSLDRIKAQAETMFLGMGEALVPLVEAIFPLIEEALPDLARIIRDLTPLIASLARVLPPLVEGTADLVGTLTGDAESARHLMGAVRELKPGVQELLDKFDEGTISAGELQEGLELLGGSAGDAAAYVAGLVSTAALVEGWGAAWSGTIGGILGVVAAAQGAPPAFAAGTEQGEAFAEAMERAGPTVQAMRARLEELADEIPTVASATEQATRDIDAAFGQLPQLIEQHAGNVQLAIGDVLDMLEAKARFEADCAELADRGMDTVAAGILAAGPGAQEAVTYLLDNPDIAQKWEEQFEGYTAGAVDAAIGELADRGDDVKKAADTLGSQLGAGMAAGINYKLTDIANAASALVTAALNAAARAAEIGSPSKLFAREIGEPVGEGIAEGIRKCERTVVEALTALMDGLNRVAQQHDEWIDTVVDAIVEFGPQAVAAMGVAAADILDAQQQLWAAQLDYMEEGSADWVATATGALMELGPAAAGAIGVSQATINSALDALFAEAEERAWAGANAVLAAFRAMGQLGTAEAAYQAAQVGGTVAEQVAAAAQLIGASVGQQQEAAGMIGGLTRADWFAQAEEAGAAHEDAVRIWRIAHGLPVQGMAAGGRYQAGQPFWAGEQGIELVVPDTSGTVIPHSGAGLASQPLLIQLTGQVDLDGSAVGRIALAGGQRQVLLRTGARS